MKIHAWHGQERRLHFMQLSRFWAYLSDQQDFDLQFYHTRQNGKHDFNESTQLEDNEFSFDLRLKK